VHLASLAKIDLSEMGRPVVLATHRRSGTHLSIDLLRRHFPACRSRKRWFEGLDSLYLNLDAMAPPWDLAPDRALERLLRAPRPIVKTHASPGFETWDARVRDFSLEVVARGDVIGVHRDVRDVLTSFHHYERSYAPEQRRSLSEFIAQKDGGVSRPRAWANQVRAWRDAGALSIAYEEIIGDPAAALERLAATLGMTAAGVEPVLPGALAGRYHARWHVAFSRAPSATTVPGATGRPVRWRDALTYSDRAFIQQEAGDLLVELGYEDSDAWVEDATHPSASAGE
jgi:hypothetical protein